MPSAPQAPSVPAVFSATEGLLVLMLVLVFPCGCTSTPGDPSPEPTPMGQPIRLEAEPPPANGGAGRYQPASPRGADAPVVHPGEAVSFGRALQGSVLGPGKATFVRDAEVRVVDPRGREVASSTSDEFGKFATTPLAPDRYVLEVTDPSGRHFARAVRDVDPSAGPVEVELERGWAISGTVSELSSRRSVPGVRVVARDQDSGEVAASTLSGAAGAFRLGPLSSGKLEIAADVPGGLSTKLHLLDDIVQLELTIPDIVYCNGMVLRSSGPRESPTAMADARVRITDAEEREILTTRTGSDGVFAIAAPPPGTYVVRVTETGGAAHGEAILVVPAEGTPRPVRVIVAGPATIHGTLSFPTATVEESEMRVWLLDAPDAEQPIQVAYPKDGRWAFPNPVSPGTYHVRALIFLPNEDRDKMISVTVESDEERTIDFAFE